MTVGPSPTWQRLRRAHPAAVTNQSPQRIWRCSHDRQLTGAPGCDRRSMSTGAADYDGDDADTEEEEEAGAAPPRGGRARHAAARAAARMAERSISPEARAPPKRRRTSASFHPRGVRAGRSSQGFPHQHLTNGSCVHASPVSLQLISAARATLCRAAPQQPGCAQLRPLITGQQSTPAVLYVARGRGSRRSCEAPSFMALAKEVARTQSTHGLHKIGTR